MKGTFGRAASFSCINLHIFRSFCLELANWYMFGTPNSLHEGEYHDPAVVDLMLIPEIHI